MDQNNFYDVIDGFETLPGLIAKMTVAEFTSVQQSEAARNAKNIVYIWRSERKFSRLKGVSDILYIGQTSRSFADRYKGHPRWINTKANSLKYNHVIDSFGSIRIMISGYKRFGDTILKAEGQLLWWYFQNHCEYPPFNYTQTRIRTDSTEDFQILV